MSYFDTSKKIYLRPSQTQGYVKFDDDELSDTSIKPRPSKGKSYVNEYLMREKQEMERAHAEEKTSEMSSLELTSIGTFVDKNELDKEELTRVYTDYYKNKPKENDQLIISHYKSRILSLIELNEVIIISGPTGCGKSTQVPQYILDSHAEKNLHCNIIVTQPRRIAAISIPKRICEERNWPLGGICGYKVGLEDCTSEDTRLTYITVGVFLQILINKKNINDFTHVIIDEIHERDQETDFCLLVVKKLINSNSRNVKVILMSATAEVEKFANYFGKHIMEKYQPAPTVNIGLSTKYVVQIHYLEELSPLGELPEINFAEPNISELGMTTCIKLIKQFERLDKDSKNKKSVLIFLPGIYEIEELYTKLKDPKIYAPGAVEYKWFPVPFHSSITLEEQALVFRPPPSGHRKIILATNIAESSITVADVMFVIDFCLTKVLVTDNVSNFTSLQLCWASKANCIQRAGRAGRVMDGRVYRMVYKSFYQRLEKQRVPDMLRSPLEKVILKAKILNMGPPKAILSLALDPPDLSDIERTILVLKEVGALLLTCKGVSNHQDGDLTYLGRLMALMPVDIQITKLIVLGHLFSCLEQCIIMGASMSLKSVFSSPFQARLKSYNAKLDWADGSCSDCIAFLNVYDVWKINHSNGYFKRSAGGGEKGWAKRHFIQLRALKEVNILVEELKRRLKMHNIEPSAGVGRVQWKDTQKAFIYKFVIAGAFYPNYFGRGARGGQVSEEEAVKILGGRDPFTTVYLTNFPKEQPRDLYSHLIKNKLIECKEDMKVSYDSSSKVYIEFRKQDFNLNKMDMPFNSEVPGKISMAVYRAVKSRLIMKHLEIKVLPPEEAKKMAEKLGLNTLKDPFENQSLQDSLFRSSLPGIDVSLMPINITHVIDPGHFWAVSKDEINEKFERKILLLLNDECADLEVFTKAPEVGTMCAAPYKDEDEVWLYRGRVDAFREVQNKQFAQIFFIDYGNVELIPVNELRKYGSELLEQIGTIPAQAFECVLTKVKPSLIKDPSGKWSDAAKKEFNELIKTGYLIASIYSVVGGIVSIVLHSVRNDRALKSQININEHLIKEGFAEEVEESVLSKTNNERRTQRQLDTDQKDVYNTLQFKENWFGNTLLEPPELEDCQMRLRLSGPFSPLEMKIFSYTRGGSFKQIRIAPGSVNSVLLDSDPQDPHQRLVVAAHVSQNQTGDTLILNHTTVMPNIHGFAALIPFVFAPRIELRVNEEKTKYTGILCGLGVDEEGVAMFPEHDMEIIFDCEFTMEDFKIINKLRFFMSLLLLTDGENGELFQNYPDTITFQNNIKNALMKLIDKYRPSQELVFTSKEFKWGLTEPDLVVDNETTLNYSSISIYPLHQGVYINPDPNEKKKLLKNVEKLHMIAETKCESSINITCKLCNISVDSPKSLRFHLITETHKKKEQKLRSELKDN